MNADELLAAYPDCPKAVSWFMLIIVGDGSEECAVADLKRCLASGMPMKDVYDIVLETARSEIGDPECKVPQRVMSEIVAQMETASFRRFLAGVFGGA